MEIEDILCSININSKHCIKINLECFDLLFIEDKCTDFDVINDMILQGIDHYNIKYIDKFILSTEIFINVSYLHCVQTVVFINEATVFA